MKIVKNVCLYLSLIAMFMFVKINNVNAIDIIPSSTTVSVGKNINLEIKDVKSGNEYSLSFEEGFLTVTSSTCKNRTSITADCNMTLTVNKNLNLTEDKKVAFKIIEKASKDEEKTVNITINANKKVTTTTAPTTTTTTTTKKVELSNNANLKTLEIVSNDGEVVALTPTFSKDVYEYNATVESVIKNVTINATMEDSKANMIVSNNASDELVSGENNKIVITVTAEDGITKKAYTINIKREALETNATLKSLFIEEEPSFELIDNKYSYDIKIKKDISKLTLDYTLSSDNATINITGNENLKNGSKIKLLVTAEDGTKKEYVLNIIKETSKKNNKKVNIPAEKNPLIIMSLSMIAFGLIGGIIYQFKK